MIINVRALFGLCLIAISESVLSRLRRVVRGYDNVIDVDEEHGAHAQ
jgi:hypothetical protein